VAHKARTPRCTAGKLGMLALIGSGLQVDPDSSVSPLGAGWRPAGRAPHDAAPRFPSSSNLYQLASINQSITAQPGFNLQSSFKPASNRQGFVSQQPPTPSDCLRASIQSSLAPPEPTRDAGATSSPDSMDHDAWRSRRVSWARTQQQPQPGTAAHNPRLA